MNTLHPVVILGSHFWNQELLPRDEFAERMRSIRALMKEHRWDGLLVFGDCAEPGLLAWLTNVCPRMRWTVALLGQTGEPILVVPGAVRDLPMTAVMTPVGDVRSSVAMAKILPEWVQSLAKGKPRIALYGAARMAASVRAVASGGLAGADSIDSDNEFGSVLQTTRPREAYLMRQGCALLAQATETFKDVLEETLEPAQAALEAERTARLEGAHDVRILLSRERGRVMEPFSTMDFPREDPSLAYFALRYLGYWVEALVSVNHVRTPEQEAVDAALEEMVDRAHVGLSHAEIISPAEIRLKNFGEHPVFGRCRVKKMGLFLNEPGQAQQPILEPGMYALTAAVCGTVGAAASVLVHVGKTGAQPVESA